MILYLCEKPSQARDIAKNLKANSRKDGYLEGGGYQVTWCVGHLLELAPPEHYNPDVKPWRIEKLPVVPVRWKMNVSRRTQKQFNVIKRLLRNTKHVVIATDADREGEVIAREILDQCAYQGKVERLWLSALDDASIQKALKQIKSGNETEKLYHAGLGRQRADWLVGMNMTMAASSLYGVNSVLSVGRVQTPTLKLVVDRDHVIENFKPQAYFVLKVQFSDKQNIAFWTTWKAPEKITNESGLCLSQQAVESVAAKVEDEPGIVSVFSETHKKQKSPLCFSLSTLQKKASSRFGYSAKKILSLVQSLYETHKSVTYPRTDCGYLPGEQLSEVSQVLFALSQADKDIKSLIEQCNPHFKSPVWNDKKVTAHHAIVPTTNDRVDVGRMSSEEFNLYDLIRRYYIAQFLGDYEYQQRKVEVTCAGETFTATGNTPVKMGWKQTLLKLKEPEDEEAVVIPHLSKGQIVENQETKVERKKTQPPSRFNDGTLIEAMKTVGQSVDDAALKKILKESSGIGTEATRANILETLFRRDYLKRAKKQVVSTEKGRALIDIVPDAVKNPILTARWEQLLDEVASGTGQLDAFVKEQAALLDQMLIDLQKDNSNKEASVLRLQSDTQNNTVYLCPKCESPLRQLKSGKGKIFWGCSQYPQCGFTTWEKNGQPSL